MQTQVVQARCRCRWWSSSTVAYPELHAAANKARSEKAKKQLKGNKHAAKTGRVESDTTRSEPAAEPQRTWEKVADSNLWCRL